MSKRTCRWRGSQHRNSRTNNWFCSDRVFLSQHLPYFWKEIRRILESSQSALQYAGVGSNCLLRGLNCRMLHVYILLCTSHYVLLRYTPSFGAGWGVGRLSILRRRFLCIFVPGCLCEDVSSWGHVLAGMFVIAVGRFCVGLRSLASAENKILWLCGCCSLVLCIVAPIMWALVIQRVAIITFVCGVYALVCSMGVSMHLSHCIRLAFHGLRLFLALCQISRFLIV